ncbi:MAG: hypothetical protein QNJ97_02385 [Myxococcota bacterium]|nr:hypothetical protein [Myxococcota bacterium]
MSNSDIEMKPDSPVSTDAMDEDIDEELLAMAGPPPSLRYGVFTGLVIALTIAMLVWFFPELKFLSRITEPPTPLGEAADLDLNTLTSNTFVALDGLPLMSKAIEFRDGIRWFSMSDNTRHFFPLTGKPQLFVQWKESDEHKAFRDPAVNPVRPGPPSHFEGHLVSRADLIDTNYERIFVFYDCLKVHPLRRCNHCLGKASLAECREFFTCIERYTAEQCVALLDASENPMDETIADLKDKVASGENADANRQKIAALEDTRLALREHHIGVASMLLEELATKAGKLSDAKDRLRAEDRAALSSLRSEILSLSFNELKVKAAGPVKHIDALPAEDRQALDTAYETLNKKRAEAAELKRQQRLLREYAEVGEKIEKTKKRISQLQAAIADAPADKIAALATSSIDPQSVDGSKIANDLSRLEAILLTPKPATTADAGPADAGPQASEPTAGQTTARNGPQKNKAVGRARLTAENSPVFQTLIAPLTALSTRLETLQAKLAGLRPQAVEAFDRWVLEPDILGQIPKELKEEKIIVSIARIEQMLGPASAPEGGFGSLLKRINQGVDALKAVQKQIAVLEATPGMREMTVVADLKALDVSFNAGQPEKDPTAFEAGLSGATLNLIEKNLYPLQLKGHLDQMAALEALLEKEKLGDIASRLGNIAATVETGDWVLFSDRIPLDKAWVALVYLVLITMLAFNVRKFWYFWITWKRLS